MSITFASVKGARPYQEDRIIALQPDDGSALLVVADGHGGTEVSKAIINRISDTEGDDDMSNPETGLRNLIAHLARVTAMFESGSTLSIAYLPPDLEHATIAIIGDSPVIVAEPEADRYHISPEHNVRTNLEERKAAEDRGGRYGNGYMWQVEGGPYGRTDGQGLQMGRALGDAELTFLSREPEIYTVALGKWLLVASDGVFDPSHEHTQDEITAVVGMIEDGADASAVVDRAVNLPTEDNASAILWRR